MSGEVARVFVLEDGKAHDVLEVLEYQPNLVRARAAFLFEIGEELKVRIERDGKVTDAVARVRAHTGKGDDRTTELELVISG